MNELVRITQEEEETPRMSRAERIMYMHDACCDFWRDHKITIIAVILLAVWTFLSCGITAHIVRIKTTKEVTQTVSQQVAADMRQGFQHYLDQMQQDEKAAQFLTGEASSQAAIEEMVLPVAEHIAGLRMDRHVTTDGVKTYIWGVDFARLDSGKYGSTIQQVLDGNVEAYKKGHAVRNEDKELARELVTAYLNGERPDKWTPDLEFAEINADGSVTARSKLKTDSTTKFWRYE